MQNTCQSCKALKMVKDGAKCALGYQIDTINKAPLETCPKPLTYLAFIELRQENKNKETYL